VSSRHRGRERKTEAKVDSDRETQIEDTDRKETIEDTDREETCTQDPERMTGQESSPSYPR
jgi:hypothetical protein